MYDSVTVRQLRQLKLPAMADELEYQLANSHLFADLTVEQRIGLMATAELNQRTNRRMARSVRAADYAIQSASINDVDFSPSRNLNKMEILELAQCSYIHTGRNIALYGPTGVGKTYLACALGAAANSRGYTTRYVRYPDLIAELSRPNAYQTTSEVLTPYTRPKVLIIDDWLLMPLPEKASLGVYSLIEMRTVGKLPTILCSQCAPAGWYTSLGDAKIADAVCDRLLSCCQKIEMQGDSMRRKQAAGGKRDATQ